MKQWPSVCWLSTPSVGCVAGVVWRPLRAQGPFFSLSAEGERSAPPPPVCTHRGDERTRCSLAPQCRQSKKGRTRPTTPLCSDDGARYQECIRCARLITHRDRTKGKSLSGAFFVSVVCCVHAFRRAEIEIVLVLFRETLLVECFASCRS